jgi:inositol hexakisphosphate/diphosphoinositol-pentakisphosphate kinase
MKRLEKHGSVEFVRFGDDLLLNKPVDEWPECHCLISFYSGGFPLGKAMEYIKVVIYLDL